MENFIKILLSTVIAESEGIGFNLDIFETGLINIVLLIAIVIYAGKDFLTETLEERKTTIVNSIQEGENRLTEAQRRLDEAQKQLNQADIVINQIKADTIKTKTVLFESAAYEAEQDLTARFNRALTAFKTKDSQVRLEIRQKLVTLILTRLVEQLIRLFALKKKGPELLNRIIKGINGDFI